jgi:hypothetical protein
LADPMSSLTLHFVLLFAVASSQIFGEVSCCCLSRALFIGWTNARQAEPSNAGAACEQSADESANDVPKCPKCAASRSLNSQSIEQTDDSPSGKFCEGNQCQCSKVAARTGLQNERLSLDGGSHLLGEWLVIRDTTLTIEQRATRSFEVPIRFGGHSWQSIACIQRK